MTRLLVLMTPWNLASKDPWADKDVARIVNSPQQCARRLVRALAAGACAGFLEALLPWAAKRIIAGELLQELSAWVAAEAGAAEGTDGAEKAEQAGMHLFLKACRDAVAAEQRLAT